jgi:hypothetical protein
VYIQIRFNLLRANNIWFAGGKVGNQIIIENNVLFAIYQFLVVAMRQNHLIGFLIVIEGRDSIFAERIQFENEVVARLNWIRGFFNKYNKTLIAFVAGL